MLGQYLKKYRLDHNLSQIEMADRLETSQSYYSLLERGTLKPGIRLIRRISALLEVDPQFVRSML